MNKTTITRTISAIYVFIVSIIIFIVGLFATLYIVLINGIEVKELKLPRVSIQQLYIKWDETITLDVEQIQIKKGKNSSFDLKELPNLFKKVKHYANAFSQIRIHTLTYESVTASLDYNDSVGHFHVHSPTYEAYGTILADDRNMVVDLDGFDFPRYGVHAKASILLTQDASSVYVKANTKIKNLDFDIVVHADTTKARFIITSDKKTNGFRPLVDPLDLPYYTERWFTDFIHCDNIYLDYFEGVIPYDDPVSVLKTLRARIRAFDVQYTFNPDLKNVRSPEVTLVFFDETLYVYPKKNKSYYGDTNTGSTWLKIDFRNNSEVLTANFSTTARFSNEINKILQAYKVNVPFIQKKGRTDAKMTMTLDLETMEVNARGDFNVKDSMIYYGDIPFYVKEGNFSLNNTQLKNLNANLDYNDTLDMNVQLKADIDLNAFKGNAEVSVNAMRVPIGRKNLILQHPVNADVTLNGNIYDAVASPSQWDYSAVKISLPKTPFLFNFDTKTAHYKDVDISIEDSKALLVAKGATNFDTLESNNTLLLNFLDYGPIKLDQHDLTFYANYDKQLDIMIPSSSHWRYDENKLTLSKGNTTISNRSASFDDFNLRVHNLLQTDLNGTYLFDDDEAGIVLKNLEMVPLHTTFHNIDMDVKFSDAGYYVDFPELTLRYRPKGRGWRIFLGDIGKVTEYVPILKEHNLTNGSAEITSRNGKMPYKIHADINYPYDILYENNRSQNHLNIHALVEKSSTYLSINNKIDINIQKNVVIEAKDQAINLRGVLQFIRDHKNIKPNRSKHEHNVTVTVNATDSYFIIYEQSAVLYDAFKLDVSPEGKYIAQLFYKDGSAQASYLNNRFYLKGFNFNDTFMNRIFKQTGFEVIGGTFDYSAKGTVDDFIATNTVKNTTIKNYVVLTNILAVINTIPALASLSLPAYNAQGLSCKEMYMRARHINDEFVIQKAYIDSNQMYISADGNFSYYYDSVNGNAKVVLSTADGISEIPVLGYILMGNEKAITIDVDVTGKLSNPNVESDLAKSAILYPWNVIKRTVLSPLQLFEGDYNESQRKAPERVLK